MTWLTTILAAAFVIVMMLIVFRKGFMTGYNDGFADGKMKARMSPIKIGGVISESLIDAFEEFKQVIIENVCECKLKAVLNEYVKLYIKTKKAKSEESSDEPVNGANTESG